MTPSKLLLSWQQRAPCLGWLCYPGVQLSGAVWVDGCPITNPDLAAHHRWAPKDLGLQACPSVLVEHKECFYGAMSLESCLGTWLAALGSAVSICRLGLVRLCFYSQSSSLCQSCAGAVSLIFR